MTTPVRPTDPPAPCIIGKFCARHDFVHGSEAEELREKMERFADTDQSGEANWARRILDEVDARDSCAWVEVNRAINDGELDPWHDPARDLAAARAEAASLREQLAAESASADSEHANLVRVSDKYRAGEDDRADLRSRLSAVEVERAKVETAHRIVLETERKAAEARVSELRGLLERRHGMECPTYDDNTKACGGCEVSVALASHPLKTEGDGGTPTGGTP